MDLWLLIKRCENADYKIFYFLYGKLKNHNITLNLWFSKEKEPMSCEITHKFIGSLYGSFNFG